MTTVRNSEVRNFRQYAEDMESDRPPQLQVTRRPMEKLRDSITNSFNVFNVFLRKETMIYEIGIFTYVKLCLHITFENWNDSILPPTRYRAYPAFHSCFIQSYYQR